MGRAEGPAPLDLETAQAVANEAGIDDVVTGVAELGDGVKSVVYRVEFAAHDPLALKVYTRAAAVDREHAGYRLLTGQVPELPSMIAGAREAPGLHNGYTLMTLVNGTPVNQLLAEMSRGDVLALYREIGRVQAEFHAVEAPTFSRLAGTSGGWATNREFMRGRIDASLAGFLELGGNRYLESRVRAYFDQHAELLNRCSTPVACHGDFHHENLMMRGGVGTPIAHVIDLEESFAGDPALDLVRTCYHGAFLMGLDLKEALLEGYGPAPVWFDEVYDFYYAYLELETWIYFAIGGSPEPLPSIARRLAQIVGASRLRIWRSAARRRAPLRSRA